MMNLPFEPLRSVLAKKSMNSITIWEVNYISESLCSCFYIQATVLEIRSFQAESRIRTKQRKWHRREKLCDNLRHPDALNRTIKKD